MNAAVPPPPEPPAQLKEACYRSGAALTSATACVQSLFLALVEPKPPKDVTFPLTEQDDIEFHASREALTEWLKTQVKKYDLKDESTKKALRDKVGIYQKKTQSFLVEAVAAGKTLQQARIGMMIAHFENLSPEFQKRGIAQGKHVVTERMTRDAVKQAADRAQAVHDKELAEIQKLKTDKDREVWIRSKLSKAETDVPDFLKPKKTGAREL